MFISPQLRAFHEEYKVSLRHRFNAHKQHAKHRNIDWEITFVEWVNVWFESGRYHQRGPGKEEYVMARLDDSGPYATWNVRVVTGLMNSRKEVTSLIAEYTNG